MCFVVCVLALGIPTAHAEIQPVMFLITSGGTAYTVPANKILVIEAISLQGGTEGSRDYATIGSFVWYQETETSQSLPSPIHLAGGNTVWAHDTPPFRQWFFSGLLVDLSDLYASITSEFESLYATAGELHGVLRLGSSRPAQVKIEETTNLTSPEWIEEPAALVARTSSDHRQFTLPLPVENQQFLRAKVRANK